MKSKYHSLSRERQYLINLIKALNLSDEELEKHFEIDFLLHEQDETESEFRLKYLKKMCKDYVDQEYEKGKHNGRELDSLFRCLFELIGDDALLAYDD